MSGKLSRRTGLLATALVVSNLLWVGWSAHHVSQTAYRFDACDDECLGLSQLLALSKAGLINVDRNALLGVSSERHEISDSFTSEQTLWIGWLGFRFAESGKLLEIKRAWTPCACCDSVAMDDDLDPIDEHQVPGVSMTAYRRQCLHH